MHGLHSSAPQSPKSLRFPTVYLPMVSRPWPSSSYSELEIRVPVFTSPPQVARWMTGSYPPSLAKWQVVSHYFLAGRLLELSLNMYDYIPLSSDIVTLASKEAEKCGSYLEWACTLLKVEEEGKRNNQQPVSHVFKFKNNWTTTDPSGDRGEFPMHTLNAV